MQRFQSAAAISLFGIASVFFVTPRAISQAVSSTQQTAPPHNLLTASSDPRTPISSLPFTITTCGSYYLTGCLTGTSGQDGITIMASDVTLDLEGFTLTGVPGSLDGIRMQVGSTRGIVVRGGIVRNWGGNGVDAAFGAQLEDLSVFDNGQHGIVTGSETTVLSCRSDDNSLDGIVVGGGCVVRDSICNNNGRHGIVAQNDGWIVSNFVDDHGSGSGILVASATTCIEKNTIADCAIGIEVTGSANWITKNRVAGGGYSIAGGNQLGPISADPASAGPWANFNL